VSLLLGWDGFGRMDWAGKAWMIGMARDMWSQRGFRKFDIRHRNIAKLDQHFARAHVDRSDNRDMINTGIADTHNKERKERRKSGKRDGDGDALPSLPANLPQLPHPGHHIPRTN